MRFLRITVLENQSLKKAAVLLAAFFFGVYVLLHVAPLVHQTQAPAYARILLSQDGQLLGAKIADDHQWRFSPVEQLPLRYEQALLLFEDKRFYEHGGVDSRAVLRAIVADVKAHRIVSGGSTLTMQLARLQRQESLGDEPSRNIWSKAVEVLMALQIESRTSKKAILNDYANRAPFGGNIVGFHAAAWRYFGRAPEQLSWAEAALLAVLPNSPAAIHLGRQRDALLKKRNRLLTKLRAANALTELDYKLSLLEPLPEKPRDLPQFAPHVLTRLMQEYPNQTVFHSTLQKPIQERVNSIAEQHSRRLASDGVYNLAIIVIDNQTMATQAYVGNRAWLEKNDYAKDVDIVTRPRSTGSILKPLLYASMLQEGLLTPQSLVPDIPAQYGSFSPQNYDRQFRGAVAAHQALAQSLNVPAVHMLKNYGVAHFQEQLTSLGMTTLFRPADDYGLSLILGGAEGTLWDLSGIYARLAATARDGSFAKQPAQVALLQSDLTNPPMRLPELHQGAAWLTLQALIDVARPGNESLWREYIGSQSIAWKTGTSYGMRDAWAIGSNSRYTVGVWAGNAGGEPAPNLTGSASAAPVMFDIFDSLGSRAWITKPDHALKKISVCVDDGYLSADMCSAQDVEIPIDSHFQIITPFHKRIHLDANKMQRVHGDCTPVSRMRNENWFVLPPAQEYYWRQGHSSYRPLPPWRTDCVKQLAEVDDDQPMGILYPQEGSRFYLPVDINGQRTQVLFRAVHRLQQAKIYWHLDDQFLGATSVFHEQSLSLEAGTHKLLLQDEQGYKLERVFKVLGAGDRKSLE